MKCASTPEITTVLLDADGVVQTSGSKLLSSIQALCTNPDQSSEFISEVFRAEKPCLTGSSDFPSALQEVLSRWNVDTPLSEALELWTQIVPVADILTGVYNLQQSGVRVGLATNQQAHRADIMATNLDYSARFDDLFFSCELGFAKPDSRFFSEILDKLQISARHVLFIDDHPENVSSAGQVGIHGEVYHVDQGYNRFRSILRRYGLHVV